MNQSTVTRQRTKQVKLSMLARCIVLTGAIILVMVLSSGRSFGQDKVSLPSLQKDSSASVWHVLKTSGNVTISYQYVDCGPVEFVQFKIANSGADSVSVSWKYKQYNNGVQKQLNPDDANVQYTVAGGAAIVGACYSSHTRLSVFVRESGMVLITTDIELTDITISNVQ